VVVVQRNGYGIPGLMTADDRMFNITCDYSDTEIAAQDDYEEEHINLPKSKQKSTIIQP
jgi:hypothetical protein